MGGEVEPDQGVLAVQVLGDREQVAETAVALAGLDANGELTALFAAPTAEARAEEGWILGVR